MAFKDGATNIISNQQLIKLKELIASSSVQQHNAKLDNFYLGIVTDVNDPYGIGRVKVYIPELMQNEDEAIWSYPIYQTEGQHLPPFVNQVVLIFFLKGSPDIPFYLGTVYHKDEILPEMQGDSYAGMPNKQCEYKKTEGDSITKVVDTKQFKNKFSSPVLQCNKDRNKAATDYVLLRTPRNAHLLHIQDNKDTEPKLNYFEFKSGADRSLIIHDGLKYLQLKGANESKLLIIDSAEEVGEQFIELSSDSGHLLNFSDTNQSVNLISAGNRGFSISDSSQKLVITSSAGYSRQQVKLTTEDKYDIRSHNASQSTVLNTSTTCSKGTIYIEFDEAANRLIIRAGAAYIIMDGNSGDIYMGKYVHIE